MSTFPANAPRPDKIRLARPGFYKVLENLICRGARSWFISAHVEPTSRAVRVKMKDGSEWLITADRIREDVQ